MLTPSAPWHLWGNTQTLTVPPVGPLTFVLGADNTLVRASYGRPETWRFLFHAVIQSGGSPTLIGEIAMVDISYDLIVGIGRSAFKMEDFLGFQWDWSGGLQPMRGQSLFTTSTRERAQAGGTPPPPPPGYSDPPHVIDQFVAENITIVVRVNYTTDVVAAVPVVVAISAQLAPNAHVRPDWFLIDKQLPEQFPGGEIGGR